MSYIKGNCLEPETFKDVLQDVDGCIHTVGALVENTKKPQASYQAMNRDTCVNMAKGLNEYGDKRNFVMISSAKAPPFLPAYLTTKIEAENFIIDECENLKPVIIRPGFIWNKEHRGWSIPLRYGCEALYWINENIGKKTPLNSATDFLFPAKPTKLETVGHFAIEGVMGNIDDKIVTPEMMIEYEK